MGLSTYGMIIIFPTIYMFKDLTRIHDIFLIYTFEIVVKYNVYCHIMRNNMISMKSQFYFMNTFKHLKTMPSHCEGHCAG